MIFLKAITTFLFSTAIFTGCQKGSPPVKSGMALLRQEARQSFYEQITNSVVGLKTIIAVDINTYDKQPTNWNANATVEYFNHFGGVDRTNLPFVFYTYYSSDDHEREVFCMLDSEKILEAHIAAMRHLELSQ